MFRFPIDLHQVFQELAKNRVVLSIRGSHDLNVKIAVSMSIVLFRKYVTLRSPILYNYPYLS